MSGGSNWVKGKNDRAHKTRPTAALQYSGATQHTHPKVRALSGFSLSSSRYSEFFTYSSTLFRLNAFWGAGNIRVGIIRVGNIRGRIFPTRIFPTPQEAFRRNKVLE